VVERSVVQEENPVVNGRIGRKHPPKPPTTSHKPMARSRLTNGKLLPAGIDGRCRDARRYRDLYSQFMRQCHGQHDQLCRQLASLVLQRERLDAAIARGELADDLHLVRLAGIINRTLARLNRVAPDTAGRDPTR
jgi:hypothetical protein